MNDIIVRIRDFPCGINGVTVTDNNGDYNIYINAKLSAAEQQRAYKHEIEHIKMRHFYSDKNVEIIEREADAVSKVI